LIHGKLGSSADVSSTSIGKQNCGDQQQTTTQDNEQPGEFPGLFLLSVPFITFGHPNSLL
jgi:hypothetical protein